MRPRDIQTIDELFEKDFKIHAFEMTAKLMNKSTTANGFASNEFTNRFAVNSTDFH
jgi:hypothetical protein